jgi:hypothetical protein
MRNANFIDMKNYLTKNTPAERFRRVLAFLGTGISLADDDAEWLRMGFLDYANGRADLEEALGLKARQGRANERVPAIIWADYQERVFRALADEIPGSLWAKAGIISDWLKWAVGIRQRDFNGLQPTLSQMNALFDLHTKAQREGLRLPTSQQQIDRILKGRRD